MRPVLAAVPIFVPTSQILHAYRLVTNQQTRAPERVMHFSISDLQTGVMLFQIAGRLGESEFFCFNRRVSGNAQKSVHRGRLPILHGNPTRSLPHITDLIEHVHIVIGITAPAGCVAVAAKGRHTLAVLRRRTGETPVQRLTRLDLAVTEPRSITSPTK